MTANISTAYSPRGVLKELFERREDEVLVAGPAGTGKAQPLGSTVWTPAGPRRMGDLAIGDLVLTPDGGSAPIVDIPFRGVAPVYRLTFSDGTQVDCSDGHLWRLGWRGADGSERSGVRSLADVLGSLRYPGSDEPRYWVPESVYTRGRRWIESAQPLGEQECQCITVGSAEGLYLTERFVVTHNSMACLHKLHAMCLANPGMRALIVRKTLASLGSTALDTFRKRVIKEALVAGVVRYYGGSSEEPPQYRYSNGSTVIIGGIDKPLKIMSSEYDLIFCQESTELSETDWESLTTRLRNGVVKGFQQLIADCNPDTGTHWLKVRCDTGKTVMLESRHEDNPTIFNEDGSMTESGAKYMGKLDRLTGVRYYRLRKGLWVAAEGIIYDEFDPVVHLVDRFPIPASWARYWTVDFGFTNPFVLQCWAEDPDGRLFLYRELYRTKRLVEDHAADIMKIVLRKPVKADGGGWRGEWTEPRPARIICDHDAEDRATLERHLGMSTSAAHKTVSDGIQAVQVRMRPAGDGRPRLFLLRDSVVHRDVGLVDAKKPTCTAEEVVGYVWAPDPSGKSVKEVPLKKDDHGCDGMRYVVAERDLALRPRVRFMGG